MYLTVCMLVFSGKYLYTKRYAQIHTVYKTRAGIQSLWRFSTLTSRTATRVCHRQHRRNFPCTPPSPHLDRPEQQHSSSMVLAHQDAWRKHPFITGCAKKPFPGLGIASAIFGAYLVVDLVAGGSSSHAHSSSGDHHYSSSRNSKFQYTREEIGERPTLQ